MVKKTPTIFLKILCAVSFLSLAAMCAFGLPAMESLTPLILIMASVCIISLVMLLQPAARTTESTTDSVILKPGRMSAVIIPVLIVLAMAALVTIILYPNYNRAQADGQLTNCMSNLKNIGVALEQYGTDNYGCYPPSLSDITPRYIVVIPTCASARRQTYVYTTDTRHKAYSVYCAGKYHNAVNSPDFPQYDSFQGLIY